MSTAFAMFPASAALVVVLAQASAGCARDAAAPSVPSAEPPAGCAAEWSRAPSVPEAIAVPEGQHLLLHALGSGTQNYVCSAAPGDGGAVYAWTLLGPNAALADCRSATIGHHFATDAGSPEWQTNDGTFVIGKKHLSFTPPGEAGKGAVPWLLLTAVGAGGAGALHETRFVQRVGTSGGVAPAAGCDEAHVGGKVNVPYTADYYFFGP